MISGTLFLGRDLSRRAALRSLLVGTGAWGSWPCLMRPALAAASPKAKRRSLILLWQDGGPSHLETFDSKPQAPAEFRGELSAIQTSLPGISFCEVLPKLARMADRFSVIRSLHQPSSDHVVGSHNALTGWYGETKDGKSQYPDLASVISRMRGGSEDIGIKIGESTDPQLAMGMQGPGGRSVTEFDPDSLPGYIDISMGLHRGGPAFLGPIHGPFQVAGDPSKPGFTIQNLHSIGSAIRFQDRQRLLGRVDRLGTQNLHEMAAIEQLRAVDGFRQKAVDLLYGSGAARAFDLSRENPAVLQRYGLHLAGQQCLLARRLVESGVGVVAVRFSPDGRGDYDKTMIGWDDHAVHGNIFSIMRMRGPQFDQSVSALIEDLEQRGMRDEVLVVLVGEFGRTPRIHVHKGCPGREHWGPAGCALVYGGGLTMGQVVGSTTAKGERPKDRPVTYQELLATIYHSMGVDVNQTLMNHAGRPVPILSRGEPIRELTGINRTKRSRTFDATKKKDVIAGSSQNVSIREKQSNPTSLFLPRGTVRKDILAMGGSSFVESIVAHDSALVDDALVEFAKFPNLRRLELNGALITDAGLAHLSQLTKLERLSLTGTQTTDTGLVHLQSLKRLSRLFFHGTSITLSGVVRLFVDRQRRMLSDALLAMGLARLDKDRNLVAIDVATTSFGDHEMQYLSHMPDLKELHLAATSITDVGMEHVGKLAQLEQLYLAKCNVGDAGLSFVAQLSQLRSLNIYGTQITSAGLQHLMGLKNLRRLLITDLKLEAAVVDELKKKRPLLTVTDFIPV